MGPVEVLHRRLFGGASEGAHEVSGCVDKAFPVLQGRLVMAFSAEYVSLATLDDKG